MTPTFQQRLAHRRLSQITAQIMVVIEGDHHERMRAMASLEDMGALAQGTRSLDYLRGVIAQDRLRWQDCQDYLDACQLNTDLEANTAACGGVVRRVVRL